MDETYRMLGREHEADLEREAERWRLANQAREPRRASRVEQNIDRESRTGSFLRAVIAAFRMRGAPADG